LSKSTGSYNVGVGNGSLQNTTNGTANTAVGYGSFANGNGDNITAVGAGALGGTLSGSSSTAIGYNALNESTGDFNTALGCDAGFTGIANTTGSNNTFIGYAAQANANNYSNSTALGVGATITGSNQVVLGRSTEKVVIPGDASMNGALRIGKDLTINGRLNVQNFTNTNIINTTVNNYQLIISEDLSLNGRLVVAGGDASFNGNIKVVGNVTAAALYASSDYRIKSNIQLLSDTSYSIDLLNPITYINAKLGRQDIGFIAHEVQEHLPFLVNGEKDGAEYQSVNYTGIIGLLTNEIQELKKQNIVLNEKIKNIEERLSKNTL
jgi:hypothetical protein